MVHVPSALRRLALDTDSERSCAKGMHAQFEAFALGLLVKLSPSRAGHAGGLGVRWRRC